MSHDFDFNPRAAGGILHWWIFGIVLVLVAGAASLAFRPWAENQETRITRETNGYVTTRQASLRQLHQSYLDLAAQRAVAQRDPAAAQAAVAIETQQRGVLRQMREEADLIPSHVQPDIRDFLQTH